MFKKQKMWSASYSKPYITLSFLLDIHMLIGVVTNCSPEESVMLHAHFPKSLGCSVVGELKADCTLKLFKLQTGPKRQKANKTKNYYNKSIYKFVVNRIPLRLAVLAYLQAFIESQTSAVYCSILLPGARVINTLKSKSSFDFIWTSQIFTVWRENLSHCILYAPHCLWRIPFTFTSSLSKESSCRQLDYFLVTQHRFVSSTSELELMKSLSRNQKLFPPVGQIRHVTAIWKGVGQWKRKNVFTVQSSTS